MRRTDALLQSLRNICGIIHYDTAVHGLLNRNDSAKREKQAVYRQNHDFSAQLLLIAEKNRTLLKTICQIHPFFLIFRLL